MVRSVSANASARARNVASGVVSIRIDPQVVDSDEVETLEDLVVAAINDATRQAQQLQAEKMGPLAGGMGGLGDSLGLPGLG